MPDAALAGRFQIVASPALREALLDSFEGRDAMVASGMEVGIREGYERLGELLAG